MRFLASSWNCNVVESNRAGAHVAELFIRFFVGGLVVSAFSILGDMFRPKSFGGLFGAAPSVSLATLALTIASNGRRFAATECSSMTAGALALGIYSYVVCRMLVRERTSALWTAAGSMVVWTGAAFLFLGFFYAVGLL